MKKLSWKYVLEFLFVVFIFVVFVKCNNAVIDNINNENAKVEKPKSFTEEEKEILKTLQESRTEVEAIKLELKTAKDEMTQLAVQAKASMISRDLDPNVQTEWLINGVYNNETGGNYYSFIINNGKPILWGFRHDGIVVWKAQQ